MQTLLVPLCLFACVACFAGFQGIDIKLPSCKVASRVDVGLSVGDPLLTFPCTDEPFFIDVSLSNGLVKEKTLSGYNSPLEGIHGDFFSIFSLETPEPVHATYIGPVATRIFPPPQDAYIKLPPKVKKGEKTKVESFLVTFNINIAPLYEFTISGRHRVKLFLPIYFKDDQGKLVKGRLKGPSVVFYPEFVEECFGASVVVHHSTSVETEYKACSNEQEEFYNHVWKDTKTLINKGIEFLDDESLLAQHLVSEWFGDIAIQSHGIITLKKTFSDLQNLLPSLIHCRSQKNSFFTEGESFNDLDSLQEFIPYYYEVMEMKDKGTWKEFVGERRKNSATIENDQSGIVDLSMHCTPGMVAWIIPRDESASINLCPAFFTLEIQKASEMLIDTLVRFEKVVTAIDYELGEEGTIQFVQQNPKLAQKNAASYQYFFHNLAKKQGDIDIIIADI